MIAFGPVPSRRLGRSLGINNIPPKACSYSCIYCQVGPTTATETERRSFYPPEEVAKAVAARVKQLETEGACPDFLTFVPDGEPSLDENLGSAIDLIRSLALPVALITNGSLLWDATVRRDLTCADWVSVKVDTVREDVWRRINRPHPSL